jgi:hypothetical protein
MMYGQPMPATEQTSLKDAQQAMKPKGIIESILAIFGL